MDNANLNRHLGVIILLIVTAFTCAWLLPSDEGIASEPTGSFKVRITVIDSLGASVGMAALDTVSTGKLGSAVTKFVTQTASSRLHSGSVLVPAVGVGATFGLPVGQGTGRPANDDAVQGGVSDSEIIVTTVNL